MLEVIPGILEKEWSEIEKKIEIAKQFSNSIHIDIIDGKFAPNTTFLDPEPFKKYSQNIYFELHMMTDNPIELVEPWGNAGIKRFLGHIEKMQDQEEFVKAAKQFGEVGLAIDGPTSIDRINVRYNDLDSILVYTSDSVGFSGPPFNPQRLKKIKDIRTKTDIPIEVDGGINDKTILLAKEAGATRFVSTSHLFGSPDPKITFANLSEIIKQ